jgi:o-succinylbenzoate synthase
VVTIRRVEAIPFAIPLRAPLWTARGPIATRRGWVVVLSADGAVGLGEATPHPAAGEAALAAVHTAIAAAARWLAGADASRLDELLTQAAALPAPAACAIDVALHDLLGRASGRAVCELLGGRVRAAVAASAPPGSLGGDGYACAKVKVGGDADAAVARVAAARAAFSGVALRADANGCWDADTAVRVAKRLRPFALEWLEQPVAPGDLAGMGRVRRDGGVPIAADEAVSGPEAVAALAAAGAADAIVLKLVQVGGLARARATAEAAAAAGLAIAVTTAIDTGIGTAAALHLASALPGRLSACGVATGGLLAGDIVAPPIPDGPTMTPPAGPGLGIVLDTAALARWRTA